ncbi:uncharacterized protein IL334_002964 [Kwoniella shivajii]|uniref:Beta-glucuronidase n=1 Tax=Kwoniella shivajii TaxID=564305 RepID=A0ABZ1CWT2_9TREE|nr:hypothetical protein IL334_002964 [Kwoniella shivajii]
MLKPIDNCTRQVKSLDGLWRFAVDSPDLSSPWAVSLPGAKECPVPASYNDVFFEPSLRDHVGRVWYQRTITIPKGWDKDQRVFLRFEAATHEAEVYADDQLIATHVGGYTPFEADLHAKPGVEVRITVAVNNILTHDTIPPGTVIQSDTGKVKQKILHDFFNYAGLARSVSLCSVPVIRVEDITVVTDVKGTTGLVRYDVVLRGSADKEQIELIDREGNVVATSTGTPSGTLYVEDVHLWQPGAAYLYTLRVRLFKDSSVVDQYTLAVGIRTIRIEGLQFLINNKPFYFRGYGRHEDTPVKGKGHDNAWMVHDFELMKWSGANSFRTSHYPYDEEVMDYADRHGWVVIDETAAVGLNLNIGGGLFGSGGKITFCDDYASDRTQASHKQAIRELVQRDKNHPSVVMWCIANEPDSGESGARAYFQPLAELTHQLDPTRPVTFTNLGMVPPEKETIGDLFDIISLNRYYGWYEDTGDLEAAEVHLETELYR